MRSRRSARERTTSSSVTVSLAEERLAVSSAVKTEIHRYRLVVHRAGNARPTGAGGVRSWELGAGGKR
jgi:hypothetical protein